MINYDVMSNRAVMPVNWYINSMHIQHWSLLNKFACLHEVAIVKKNIVTKFYHILPFSSLYTYTLNNLPNSFVAF